jgi:23S rRNA U2552 (ribose-2'-O)-methylase RlmE/FtsJ
VPKEILFHKHYPYRSGITQSLVENLHKTASSVLESYDFAKESLVVDIGSNDGSLLSGFKKSGMSVLGVEASDIARIANEIGIETIQDFFSDELAKEIRSKFGAAKIITATNVFAHVSDTTSIMRGIDYLLDEKGIFVSESHYLLDLLDYNQFDSIYHEHLKYYSVSSIDYLLNLYDYEIVKVERIKNYGGSIRVYSSRKGDRKVDNSVSEIKKLEKEFGINQVKTFVKFKDRVEKVAKEILKTVTDINQQNKTIVGVGAPGRSSTLLSYCGININMLPVVYEQETSLKLNKYMPTSHIPIKSERELLLNQPDYVLLLSWHYSESIIRKLRNKGLTSKIIVPLPEVRIID